jgi:hypothetical protein
MTRRDGAIVAGPDDDDLDPNGPDDDDELDEDELETPPAQQQGPTREELLAEVQRLRRGNTRNNRELQKTRQVTAWMKKHGITDLEQWLADQQTPSDSPGEVSGSPTETLGTPPGHVDNPPAPSAPPAPPAPPSEAEVERRVRLELERRQAQDDERVDKLTQSLRASAIQAALSGARFSGTVATALKVIDQSKIEVDADGNVTGVDDAVAELRAEIPEWFRRPAQTTAPSPTRNGGAVDGGEKRPPAAKPRRWEDQIVDRWRGGR